MSTPRPWTLQEDNLLKDAVALYGEEPGMWKTIAHRIPGRTNKACRKRWLHSLSPTVKKTPWTPEEDALLLKLYATHNPPRWSLIAKCIPGRTDDACSKRYREALDPQLKKDEWTLEEDANLLRLTTELGSKWTQVGQAMGRSGLGCRNRWRLLQRKQRPRNTSHPSTAFQVQALMDHVSPYIPTQSTSGFLIHDPSDNSLFEDGSDTQEQPHTIDHPSELMSASLEQTLSTSLIHGPPLTSISTVSSLSGALASASSSSTLEALPVPSPCTPIDPDLLPPFPSSTQPRGADHTATSLNEPTPSFSTSLLHSQSPSETDDSPVSSSQDPSPPETHTGMPGTPKQSRSISQDAHPKPPRKRARLRGPPSAEHDVTELPRLSSHLPATVDRSVLPYACGHPLCWPGPTGEGASRFPTASELAEHRRLGHPHDDSGNKAFRCALQGCGKGWKNINGIQYHLQISKAHFKAALLQTRSSSDAGIATTLAPKDKVTKPPKGRRKEFPCPHQGCTNTYKQRTGLQYHLAHGHPTNIAQLQIIPPGLMRIMSQTTKGPTEDISRTTPHPQHMDAADTHVVG